MTAYIERPIGQEIAGPLKAVFFGLPIPIPASQSSDPFGHLLFHQSFAKLQILSLYPYTTTQ
jgi:hypothetical protein